MLTATYTLPHLSDNNRTATPQEIQFNAIIPGEVNMP